MPVGLATYFKDAELGCKHCGMVKLHRGFREALVELRGAFGRPMTLNSACRCKAHNDAVRGHPKSLHVADVAQHPGQLGTLAVDVATPDGAYRGKLFSLAWERGWSIGIAKTFLHIDRRIDIGLPQTTYLY